jgi:hypothetical protein
MQAFRTILTTLALAACACAHAAPSAELVDIRAHNKALAAQIKELRAEAQLEKAKAREAALEAKLIATREAIATARKQ